MVERQNKLKTEGYKAMEKTMNKNDLTTYKVLGTIILSILGMSVGQIIAILIQNLFSVFQLPMVIGNIIAGGVYIAISYTLIKLVCNQFLKVELEKVRIGKIRVVSKWCIVAIILPVFVLLTLLSFPGRWEQSIFEKQKMMEHITLQVFLIGMGAGMIEEMTFRGVIMSVIERKWGKKVAILVPSIIFALGHVAAKPLDGVSFWLLFVAGVSVGIMFSLITYESGSIWCGALVHAVWNACISGGLIDIGVMPSEGAVYSYILDVNSPIITGGNYGIESSAIAILGYLIVALVAWLGISKKVKNRGGKKFNDCVC